MLRNTKPKGPSYPGGDDPMDIGAFGKGKGKGKGKHVKGKAKGSKNSKDSKTRTGTGTGTRTRTRLKVGIVEGAVTPRRFVGARRTRPTKVVQRGKNKNNNARLESTRVQKRLHGTQAPHTGNVFRVMWISLSAQPLENVSSLAIDCTLKVAINGESISEFEVSQHLCANHCCLLERRRVELECCEEKRSVDPGEDERFTIPWLRTKTTTCKTST